MKPHIRVDVAAQLEDLAQKSIAEQIDSLESIHQELTTRLNRAQL